MTMSNNDKVLTGLRCCSHAADVVDCRQCPYHIEDGFRNGCERQLMADALDLIRDQQFKLETYDNTIRGLLIRM